jgi:hypothetical protein
MTEEEENILKHTQRMINGTYSNQSVQRFKEDVRWLALLDTKLISRPGNAGCPTAPLSYWLQISSYCIEFFPERFPWERLKAIPWLWAPKCLLFPWGFQPFCDWLKLGRILVCKLGNFSFLFILYSIRRIKQRAWANFQVCWCFPSFINLLILSKIQIFVVPAVLWLAANWAELSRVNWGIFRFHLFLIRFSALNYVSGQIFKCVDVFLHFIYLFFGRNSNFCGSRRFMIAKLGRIIACKQGYCSFSFIFYSIRRIQLRVWAKFQICWCFCSYYSFINSVEIQIFMVPAGLWLAEKLGRIIACKQGYCSFSFICYSILRIKLRVWADFQIY